MKERGLSLQNISGIALQNGSLHSSCEREDSAARHHALAFARDLHAMNFFVGIYPDVRNRRYAIVPGRSLSEWHE